MISLTQITIPIFFIYTLFSLTTTPILWKSNPFISTGQAYIKTDVTTTFDQKRPINKTFNFTQIYTQLPQTAFAIKNYRGNDKLIDQNFHIKMTSLTLTGFTLSAVLTGYTHIRIMTVLYMAVDRSFPYHLNIFRDIGVDHESDALTNISASFSGVRTYTNTINYTTLASSINSSFTKFGPDLTTSRVALYISGQSNDAQYQVKPLPQVKFDITTEIVAVDQFKINIIVDQGLKIYDLRFGIVAFDILDVEKSKEYTIVFSYNSLSGTITNYIPLQKQFQDSTFIGLTDFSAANPHDGMEFNWQFDPINNQIILNQSVPYSRSTALSGLKTYLIAVFYVKSWYCPVSSYYDPVTKVCNIYTCGDGDWVIPYENCDDNNLIDFDGCSSTCNIDSGFECLVEDKLANGSSFCKYTQNVALQFESIQKSPTSNSLSIFFTLSPPSLPDWTPATIENLFTTVQIQSLQTPELIIMPSTNITINYDPNTNTNQIEIVVNYDSVSLENTQLVVTIEPSNTNIPSIMHLPNIHYATVITSGQSAVPFYSYPPEIYEFKDSLIVQHLSQVIGFVCLVMIMVGFVLPAGKLVIVECLAVVQISYFSLLQIQRIPPTYDELRFLIYATGYFNMSHYFGVQQGLSTSVYQILGLKDNILMNYNLSIGLFAVPLLVGTCAITIVKTLGLSTKSQISSSIHNQNQQNASSKEPQQNTGDKKSKQQDQYKQAITIAPQSRSGVMIELSKRLMLEFSLYGILICGYLLWVIIFHSLNLNLKFNTIVTILFGSVWFCLMLVFLFYKGSPIDLQNNVKRDQSIQCQPKLQNPFSLPGFGQFKTINTQITAQKHYESKFLQRIYLLLIIERISTAFVIVCVSASFKQSPSIIIVFFLVLFLVMNIFYQLIQRNLAEQNKKPLFSYLYQNYVLRQSINYITIVAVQSLILGFENERKATGEQFVLAQSGFTVKTLPLLLLSFLLVNILVNSVFWIWEIKNSQIITKAGYLSRIIFPKSNEPYLSKNNEIANGKTDHMSSSTNRQKNRKKLKIIVETGQDEMLEAMNAYTKNSKIFQNIDSPFEGISENQGSKKLLLDAGKINRELPLLEEEKTVDLMYRAKNKGYYNKLYDEI